MKQISLLLLSLTIISQAYGASTKMSLKEAQDLVSQPTPAIQTVLNKTPNVYDFKNENKDHLAKGQKKLGF